MTEPNCLGCNKQRGESPPPGGVVYKDDLVHASHVYIPEGAERVYLGWLVPEHLYPFVLGHHVQHLHLHLFPRYPNTPREYWWPPIDQWPDAPRGGEADVAQLVVRIRSAL